MFRRPGAPCLLLITDCIRASPRRRKGLWSVLFYRPKSDACYPSVSSDLRTAAVDPFLPFRVGRMNGREARQTRLPFHRAFSSQNLQLCSRLSISVESTKDRSFAWSDMAWPAALKIGQVASVLSPGTPCLTNAPK